MTRGITRAVLARQAGCSGLSMRKYESGERFTGRPVTLFAVLQALHALRGLDPADVPVLTAGLGDFGEAARARLIGGVGDDATAAAVAEQPDRAHFGETLRRVRKQRRMTQMHTLVAANVSNQGLWNWEKLARFSGDPQKLLPLIRALHCARPIDADDVFILTEDFGEIRERVRGQLLGQPPVGASSPAGENEGGQASRGAEPPLATFVRPGGAEGAEAVGTSDLTCMVGIERNRLLRDAAIGRLLLDQAAEQGAAAALTLGRQHGLREGEVARFIALVAVVDGTDVSAALGLYAAAQKGGA